MPDGSIGLCLLLLFILTDTTRWGPHTRAHTNIRGSARAFNVLFPFHISRRRPYHLPTLISPNWLPHLKRRSWQLPTVPPTCLQPQSQSVNLKGKNQSLTQGYQRRYALFVCLSGWLSTYIPVCLSGWLPDCVIQRYVLLIYNWPWSKKNVYFGHPGRYMDPKKIKHGICRLGL